MDSHRIREELIDDALRRVAVVHQQHSVKCCLAIFRLVERFPEWGPEAPRDLAAVLREEPVAPDIGHRLPSDTNFDTVGGARRLVEKALFPAAYVAMRRWVEESSLEAVLDVYRERACAEPDYLGHNVSIYCSLLGIRPFIEGNALRQGRFLDRFTEFVTATFHSRNRIVFDAEQEPLEPTTPETILNAAFRRPGFFGHQILAFVWARRHASALGPDGYAQVLGHLHRMSYWRIPAKNIFSIRPADGVAHEGAFADAIRTLAFRGPENIHRVTLADALVDVWDSASDDQTRALTLGAARHFARSPRA
jgi:hypothetical protein